MMKTLHTAHQMYAHITWNTASRTEFIDGEIKRALKSVIDEAARQDGYEIIAFETVSDHVHLLIRFKPAHRISDLVKAIKGKSSRTIPYLLNKPLHWQKGYSVTSLGPKLLDKAIEYVRKQKLHHQERSR